MEFISTKEAAAKWNISQRRIVKLASEGRIAGARFFGTNWMIPADAQKPADGRTRAMKSANAKAGAKEKSATQQPKIALESKSEAAIEVESETPFRFPIYINADEDSFVPPLSDEEKLLRQAQLDFNACRYDAARAICMPLSESVKNRYVRICTLLYCCRLAAYYNNNQEFDRYLRTFYLSIAEDFPYRKEMLLLCYRLDADFGYFGSLLEGLHVNPYDAYHPTALDSAMLLSICTLTGNDPSLMSKLRLETYELICMKMEHDGHLFEAQNLHCALIETYQAQANEDMSIAHMRRTLEIALEHELLLRPVSIAFYYPNLMRKVLVGFPDDFAKKIRSLGRDLHNRYVKFTSKREKETYQSILSDREFVLISLVIQGLTGKQIANKIGVSEKTVSKRFGEIYSKLGVKSRTELVSLVVSTHASETLMRDMA